MATITATPHDAPAVGVRARQRMREAWNKAVRQAQATVSAARLRLSPALTIAGLTSGVTSAWHTYGTGAGLAALSAAFFLLDWALD